MAADPIPNPNPQPADNPSLVSAAIAKAFRPVPPEALRVLSRKERLKFFLLANRVPIGGFFTGLFALLRLVLVGEHTHAYLSFAELALNTVTLVAFGTAMTGFAKPDSQQENLMHEEVRRRSGQYPVYRKRSGDRREQGH